MKTIYKYILPLLGGPQQIKLPQLHNILAIQVQNREICMWAEVDTDSPLGVWRYEIIGTGWEIKYQGYDREYLETVQVGSFVWHIYQINLSSAKNITP